MRSNGTTGLTGGLKPQISSGPVSHCLFAVPRVPYPPLPSSRSSNQAALMMVCEGWGGSCSVTTPGTLQPTLTWAHSTPWGGDYDPSGMAFHHDLGWQALGRVRLTFILHWEPTKDGAETDNQSSR